MLKSKFGKTQPLTSKSKNNQKFFSVKTEQENSENEEEEQIYHPHKAQQKKRIFTTQNSQDDLKVSQTEICEEPSEVRPSELSSFQYKPKYFAPRTGFNKDGSLSSGGHHRFNTSSFN